VPENAFFRKRREVMRVEVVEILYAWVYVVRLIPWLVIL
jgi:hypothetical protein